LDQPGKEESKERMPDNSSMSNLAFDNYIQSYHDRKGLQYLLLSSVVRSDLGTKQQQLFLKGGTYFKSI